MIMKKELLYPFDANYILAKKKRIKRELLAEGERFVDKKIAILGGSTTNDIKLILELLLLSFRKIDCVLSTAFVLYAAKLQFPYV